MIALTRSLQRGAFALLVTTASAFPITAQAHGGAPITAPSSASSASSADAIACPLDDDSEFIDSWGAARSGGRRHEGVDMIAPRGTPVIAAQTGDAEFKQNRLGGNAVWITTTDGNKFYYAHLDSFEGSSRPVIEGEVIGYVGSSGNAKGPHLHFETHFEGSVGNPYPATFDACVQPALDALHDFDALRRGSEFSVLPGSTDSAILATRDEAVVTLDGVPLVNPALFRR